MRMPSPPWASTRFTYGATYFAPASAASRPCAALYTAVPSVVMPAVFSALMAISPWAVTGIFTTISGIALLRRLASATMPSASRLIVWANSLPFGPMALCRRGSTSQIDSRLAAMMLGLVVTPARGKTRARRSTSATLAVSRYSSIIFPRFRVLIRVAAGKR